ncbi:hypothetical protein [Maribacter sp. ACAM166]|uniref:hypothetical protein n=1 Tax=Maribacter sp. ACAM166 TaxID=2508996 RepID=UPI0010FD592A|nr:hypothetical protein [Maribacter sp. ACAM166]TLP81362.1 hypothetical protein ES765_04970 [Maribacter sp. ACAM166]
MKTKVVLRSVIALMAFMVAFVGYSNDTPEVSVAMALAMNEYAEKELIKQFRHTGSWLARVPSKNQWVNNDVIKLTEIGADPTVLINNSTYPIAVSARADDSVAVSLYKYDTENTKITDDEVYALPYDKPGSVQAQHRETLEEATEAHALHSLAPSGNTANTPIILTTGATIGTRKRLISADLIIYKKTLDLLKIPKAGRCLVLSADHMADLLLEDKALELQYHNHKEGAIAANYYGFEIYESIHSPVYDASLDKIAYGSVTEGRAASVLFHVKASAKARGSVARYMAMAKDDPQNRQTVVGFRLYFLAIPLRALGQGAIVDTAVA